MTKNFTPRQLKFIELKAAGYTNAKAMVGAGYSENGANQAGSVMAKRPDMQAAIKKAKSKLPKQARNAEPMHDSGVSAKSVKMQREKYTDPEQFLRDLMNNPGVPLLMRKDAAKDLMPYCHARIGEKGKKETAKDDAKKIAGSKSKFQTGRAPKLPAGVADISARRAANG